MIAAVERNNPRAALCQEETNRLTPHQWHPLSDSHKLPTTSHAISHSLQGFGHSKHTFESFTTTLGRTNAISLLYRAAQNSHTQIIIAIK